MTSWQNNSLFFKSTLLTFNLKWAGKTIALGTFPVGEADEKCARAKALTRAWRSTMRPKPTREWVMLELERLQVRVVSGRLGRKEGGGDDDDDDSGGGDDDDDDKKSDEEEDKKTKKQKTAGGAGMMNGNNKQRLGNLDWSGNEMGGYPGGRGMGILPGDNVGGQGRDTMNLGADSNLIDDENFGGGGGGQSNRPYVGGGSAAAYEAARADFYKNSQQQKKDRSRGDSSGSKAGGVSDGMNFSGGGAGFLNANGGMPHLGLSVNPNQHYEMLKLHHMNLLNEIQETTLMMNLYQQQQLQQQQQQQKKSQQADAGMDPLVQLGQRGGTGMDASSFPSIHPQASGNMMGLGVGAGFGSTGNMSSLLQGQFGMNDSMGAGMNRRPSLEQSEDLFGVDLDPQSQIEEQERKLRKMKEELARSKRPMNGHGGDKNKRIKGED